jgi:hypothetical protein
MSAKIESPFTAEELRDMYEVQMLSVANIANRIGRSRSYVHRAMSGLVKFRRSGGDTRLATGRPEIPGRDWLEQEYWRHGRTCSQIGEIWAERTGRDRPYTASTVIYWMKNQGISRRRKRDHLKALANTPRMKLRASEHMRRVQAGKKTFGNQTPQHMDKIRRLAISKSIREGRETRSCCMTGCTNPVNRKKSEFKLERWYCSKSHSNAHRAVINRQEIHDAMLEGLKQQADALALKARNDARAQLGLPPEQEAA